MIWTQKSGQEIHREIQRIRWYPIHTSCEREFTRILSTIHSQIEMYSGMQKISPAPPPPPRAEVRFSVNIGHEKCFFRVCVCIFIWGVKKTMCLCFCFVLFSVRDKEIRVLRKYFFILVDLLSIPNPLMRCPNAPACSLVYLCIYFLS